MSMLLLNYNMVRLVQDASKFGWLDTSASMDGAMFLITGKEKHVPACTSADHNSMPYF